MNQLLNFNVMVGGTLHYYLRGHYKTQDGLLFWCNECMGNVKKLRERVDKLTEILDNMVLGNPKSAPPPSSGCTCISELT
jgi:hypothetical protein